uniref:Light harvesting complex protein 5 n=1 Tax=Guillardia theta TaxID=55529 RepID=A8KCP5_GUITH|nr:light harvesting complex protein 5 precursor [Guillardia theta]
MLRAISLLAAAASAAAFAPAPAGRLSAPAASRAAISRGPRMAVFEGSFSESVPFLKQPTNLDGSLPGDVGFDPLGFSEVFDVKVLREAELKHGRIAMLAVLGWLVQESYTFPFFDKVSPIEAHDLLVKSGGMSQILLWTSFLEIFGGIALFQTIQGTRYPGDFSFDPLGLSAGKNEANLEKYQLAEIKHGRLAMIAFGGFAHQYFITKQGVFEQLGTSSPSPASLRLTSAHKRDI